MKIEKQPILKRFAYRFACGLLRDFFRLGLVFAVLFTLIMLHLTRTIEVPFLDDFFKMPTEAQSNAKGNMPSSLETPNLFPASNDTSKKGISP